MGFGGLSSFISSGVSSHPGRIFLLPAVRPDDLMPWTASADVCFVGQPPRTLNQKMNLPNKLFESIMAGVPVVVSQGNEQCRLTSTEGLGVCADIDDPGAIAAACAGLLCFIAGVAAAHFAERTERTPGTTRSGAGCSLPQAGGMGQRGRGRGPLPGQRARALLRRAALVALPAGGGATSVAARRVHGRRQRRPHAGGPQLRQQPFAASCWWPSVSESCTGFVVAPQGGDGGALPAATRL
jgi:hypothetical protein